MITTIVLACIGLFLFCSLYDLIQQVNNQDDE